MKRRTRIDYMQSRTRSSGADISKVIPCVISPECSPDIILLSCPLSTRLVDIVPCPKALARISASFGKFDRRVLTLCKYAGFIVELKPIAFFFRPGSTTLRIGEHDGALFIYYTVSVLT